MNLSTHDLRVTHSMPPDAHRIRLAGIWEIARSPSAATADSIAGTSAIDAVEWTRVRLDRLAEEGLPFAATSLRRFFNRPTNLAVGQAVFLEWRGLSRPVRISMNGRHAAETDGGAEVIRLRIDDRLAERNDVTLTIVRQDAIEMTSDPAASASWPFAECWLAIEPNQSIDGEAQSRGSGRGDQK